MSTPQQMVDNSDASETTTTTTYDDVLELKKAYYETNTKNVFFKKSQKFDCAKDICSKFNIVNLMDSTFWLVPNKHKFYFDYRMYKLYGHPENFRLVVDNILHMTNWCIDEYKCFEIHLNLCGFSVSAAERYRNLIQLFCDICMNQTEREYLPYMITMNIYNIPLVFDNISKILMPILPPELIPKIRLIKKAESDAPLAELYAESGKIYTP